MPRKVPPYLVEELNGKLLLHVYVINQRDNVMIIRTYYTVKQGVCYLVSDSGLSPTNDCLWDVYTQCKHVGEYDPNVKYKDSSKTLDAQEFEKIIFG